VKELLKSDSICQSYAQMKKVSVFFWLTVYIIIFEIVRTCLVQDFIKDSPKAETANILSSESMKYDKKYVLLNSEYVQYNFFIWNKGNVTFNQFKICCYVQNFKKIRWFLSRVNILTRDIDNSNSVCLSIRPWRSGIRWKRLNISS